MKIKKILNAEPVYGNMEFEQVSTVYNHKTGDDRKRVKQQKEKSEYYNNHTSEGTFKPSKYEGSYEGNLDSMLSLYKQIPDAKNPYLAAKNYNHNVSSNISDEFNPDEIGVSRQRNGRIAQSAQKSQKTSKGKLLIKDQQVIKRGAQHKEYNDYSQEYSVGGAE